MTRRTVVYENKIGKLYASAEFNGDKTEFEMFRMSGTCVADWDEIQNEFSGVKTLQDFIKANGRAQKYYKPCRIYNGALNTFIAFDREILPVDEIGDISEITSDYIIYIKN